jgi:hypothetical protein
MVWFQIQKHRFCHYSININIPFALLTLSAYSILFFFLAWKYSTLLIGEPDIHVVLKAKMEFAYHLRLVHNKTLLLIDFVLMLYLCLLCNELWDQLD